MKSLKNNLTVTLMLSSILLLLVFQALWLRSAYHKAYDDLRKETSLVFRSTVLALHDSLLVRSIERVPGDSMSHRFFRIRQADPMSFDDREPDTFRRRPMPHDVTRIQVVVPPNGNDSLPPDIRPAVSVFSRSRREGNFIFRLRQDTLSLDSISMHYKEALSNSGIGMPFQVVHFRRGDKQSEHMKAFITEPVRINPINRYAAIFPEVKMKVFREIVPQVLFSVFLTLLTVGSFYSMYRNLTAQRKMAELKNDFISNITHELKTPITTVGVALEALRNFKGLDNPQLTREYLDIAQNELSRLTLLTDKVLKTAVFEKNGVSFQSEKVDMESLVDQVLSSMKLVFERSGAEVAVEKAGTDFTVNGGADHLTNIIYNLLDNAMKYSPNKPQISISLKDMNDRVVLTVSDKGLGIAPEYHKKIFEKFFRVPTGDIHNIKGYGLGLSYVANVVHRHRGTIHVDSQPGQGSGFVVSLPKYAKD